MVHHVLKYTWGVGESERHHLEFEQYIASSEYCLPFVRFFHADEVEPVFEVYFREPLCSMDSVLQFLH